MSAFLSSAITVPAAYATSPDVSLDFEPDTLMFRAVSGNFFFSFDGVNDHGMVNAADSGQLVLPTKRKKVWLKQNGGASTARVGAITTV